MENQPAYVSQESYNALVSNYQKLAEDYHEQQRENARLQEELKELKRLIYGAKSERFIPEDNGQLSIGFQEQEPASSQAKAAEEEEITYKRPKKPKQGEKAVRVELPSHLPRESHVLEPENRSEQARKIGEEVTEILEYSPGSMYVKQYVRPKYSQPAEAKEENEKTHLSVDEVVIASMPTLPIPQGNTGPGLLAHLLISKYVDHLPFYRQIKQFQRQGVNLSESTINGWFKSACKLLEPLYEVLRQKIQASGYINADETPMPVQSGDKKGVTHTGYQWVYHSPRDKLVCFDYHPGRGKEAPLKFLGEFQGILQTDAYAGYEQFANQEGVIMVGCLAHARRYFEKALDNDKQRAEYVLMQMQKLYKIERKAKEEDLSFHQRYELRQQEALPVLNELEAWLKTNASQVFPKTAIGKAIHYSLGIWSRLKCYADYGHCEIDNNMVENDIRPVALGRKNYLFAGNHQAAQNAAMMYSFLGSCKLNGVEPFHWLKDTLAKIPDYSVNELENLLPGNQSF